MRLHEVWLKKAENDLKSAKRLSGSDDPLLDTAIYHTQQCAEKALKAYLSYKQEPLQKTHDLEFLVEMCCKIDNDFEQFLDDAEVLTPYNTIFRYPGPDIEPHSADVSEAIEKAEKILSFVKQLIQ